MSGPWRLREAGLPYAAAFTVDASVAVAVAVEDPCSDAADASGRDAGAHEVQDSCAGHPQQAGIYHYHFVSACLMAQATGPSTLVGYALDGYGIYVERDAQGNLPTNADLDACHGRTSLVMWDGKPTVMYHYDATREYPYTLGCYHGTPVVQRGGR